MPISPPNGADSPRAKIVFVRFPRAKTSMGQIGGNAPGSEKPLKCPNPKSTNFGGKNELLAKMRHVIFFLTVAKHYPRSMKYDSWWTLSLRVWVPQSSEMGFKCQFWKFQTPISPLNGGRFPETKTIFLRTPRATKCKDQMGLYASQGGKGPKCPKQS